MKKRLFAKYQELDSKRRFRKSQKEARGTVRRLEIVSPDQNLRYVSTASQALSPQEIISRRHLRRRSRRSNRTLKIPSCTPIMAGHEHGSRVSLVKNKNVHTRVIRLISFVNHFLSCSTIVYSRIAR